MTSREPTDSSLTIIVLVSYPPPWSLPSGTTPLMVSDDFMKSSYRCGRMLPPSPPPPTPPALESRTRRQTSRSMRRASTPSRLRNARIPRSSRWPNATTPPTSHSHVRTPGDLRPFMSPRSLRLQPTPRLLSPPLPSSPWLRPTLRLLSPPLPSNPRLRPTPRLLSSPLPSGPRLRPTPRRLSSPLPSSPRLRPTSRPLPSPLRRSPRPRTLSRSPPPSLRNSLWEQPLLPRLGPRLKTRRSTPLAALGASRLTGDPTRFKASCTANLPLSPFPL